MRGEQMRKRGEGGGRSRKKEEENGRRGTTEECFRNLSKSVGTSHATVGCASRQQRIQTHGIRYIALMAVTAGNL